MLPWVLVGVDGSAIPFEAGAGEAWERVRVGWAVMGGSESELMSCCLRGERSLDFLSSAAAAAGGGGFMAVTKERPPS